MRKFNRRIRFSFSFLWPFFGLLLGAPHAHALEVMEFGVLNLALPHLQSPSQPDRGASGGMGVGAGVAFNLHLNHDFSFESGLIFVQRNYSDTTVPQAAAAFQIPILIRYEIWGQYSLGLGAYFSHSTGDVTIGGTSTYVSQYNDLSQSLNEWGIAASARYKTPLNDLMNLIIDMRFIMGLTEKDTSQLSTLQFRELQWLVGVGFII